MKKRENCEGHLGRAESGTGKSGHVVVLLSLLLNQGNLNGATTGHYMPDSDCTPLLPHSLQKKPDQDQILRRQESFSDVSQ